MKARDQLPADHAQYEIRPPPGFRRTGPQRSDRDITQPGPAEILYHLVPFPGLVGARFQMLHGAAAADHEMLAGRIHPLGRGLHQLDQIAGHAFAPIGDRAHPDPFAGQREGNEKRSGLGDIADRDIRLGQPVAAPAKPLDNDVKEWRIGGVPLALCRPLR